MALLPEFVKFSHLLANVITDIQLALRSYHLVIFLVFERLLTDWIVAHYFSTLCLMFFNFRKSDHGWTMGALDPERVNNFFDNS